MTVKNTPLSLTICTQRNLFRIWLKILHSLPSSIHLSPVIVTLINLEKPSKWPIRYPLFVEVTLTGEVKNTPLSSYFHSFEPGYDVFKVWSLYLQGLVIIATLAAGQKYSSPSLLLLLRMENLQPSVVPPSERLVQFRAPIKPVEHRKTMALKSLREVVFSPPLYRDTM